MILVSDPINFDSLQINPIFPCSLDIPVFISHEMKMDIVREDFV
jgi:hypothetical protein